jgi:hypothetical protein
VTTPEPYPSSTKPAPVDADLQTVDASSKLATPSRKHRHRSMKGKASVETAKALQVLRQAELENHF